LEWGLQRRYHPFLFPHRFPAGSRLLVSFAGSAHPFSDAEVSDPLARGPWRGSFRTLLFPGSSRCLSIALLDSPFCCMETSLGVRHVFCSGDWAASLVLRSPVPKSPSPRRTWIPFVLSEEASSTSLVVSPLALPRDQVFPVACPWAFAWGERGRFVLRMCPASCSCLASLFT
jgi:hypothetical protein